jgi:hypothetical protein
VMGRHQGLETCLFMDSNGLEDNLLQVQALGRGQGDVEVNYTPLAGRCPESMITPC